MRRVVAVGAAGMMLASCGTDSGQSTDEAAGVVSMTTVQTEETTSEETTPEETTTEETVTESTEEITETSSPEADECGSLNAEQALQENVGRVREVNGWTWTTKVAGTELYDPCADLSPITVTVENATAASPFHIMLFNKGEYLGTATYEPYGYGPQIVRLSDNSIGVTYKYLRPGESTPEASGRTYATFTWDEAQDKVVMSGDVPPLP